MDKSRADRVDADALGADFESECGEESEHIGFERDFRRDRDGVRAVNFDRPVKSVS